MLFLFLHIIYVLSSVYSLSLTDQLCAIGYKSVFCSSKRNNTRTEIKENSNRLYGTDTKLLQPIDGDYLRLARDAQDDPSCPKLKQEYDSVCFGVPPVQAILETKAFCDAFVEMCSNLLKTNLFTKIKGFRIDFSRYCKKEKERFDFVCPDPLRFHNYAEDAVDFCIRYKDRCPDEQVPSKPVPFRKTKDRIWTREIKTLCDRLANFAANYCTNPDILRVPKYQLPCGLYKYQCVDIYSRVIYG